MFRTRTILLVLVAMALMGADKPKPRLIQPRWEFRVRTFGFGSGKVCFSEDGKGLLWLFDGGQGLVLNQRWELPSGRPIASKPLASKSIDPELGGDHAGGPYGSRHIQTCEPTWETLSAPLDDWMTAQEFDFDAGTQMMINGESGRDTWKGCGIEPGWLISELSVWKIGKEASLDSLINYTPEWVNFSTPQKKDATYRFLAQWLRSPKNIEAVAPDGSWIAAVSSVEPIQPLPDQGPWQSQDERVLRIWQAGKAMPLHRIPLGSEVSALSFSPHGHYLVVGYGKHESELWDTQLGVLVGRFSTGATPWWRPDEGSFLYFSSKEQIMGIQVPSLEEQVPIALQGLRAVNSYYDFALSPDRHLAALWKLVQPQRDGPSEIQILVFDLSEAREVPHASAAPAEQTLKGH